MTIKQYERLKVGDRVIIATGPDKGVECRVTGLTRDTKGVTVLPVDPDYKIKGHKSRDKLHTYGSLHKFKIAK